MKNHTLIALDSNGSAVTASDVIVLNPVDDSVCNLQCAVGWYDVEYGNAAPFLCAAETADRTSREGTATYPISCTSAFFFCAFKLWCAYGMHFQCSCDYACKNTYIFNKKYFGWVFHLT